MLFCGIFITRVRNLDFYTCLNQPMVSKKKQDPDRVQNEHSLKYHSISAETFDV